MIQTAASKPFFASFKTPPSAVQGEAFSWLSEARRDDVRFLDTYELPSYNNEDWKYSPLAPLWLQSFSPVTRSDAAVTDDLDPYLIKGARNILIVNGHVADGQSSLSCEEDADVSCLAGDKAFKALTDAELYCNSFTRNDAELFCRLNRLFFNEPLIIIARKAAEAGLVHIINVITLPGAAVFPRVLIRVEEGAGLNVLQSYVSLSQADHLNVPVTDIVLEDGARLEYAERHSHSSALSYFGAVRVWQKKDSTFHSMMSTLGAGLFRSNISVMIEGEGASTEVNGLHHLTGEAHADSHTFIDHQVPNTSSNQLYKCILEDASRSVFNGRVYVQREAQKTNSYQLNKNLLLSRECRVDTKPQLEIKADDVKCTHGATISQLDNEQLFYLQTRAVGRDDARRMLVRGFIDDVLSRVRHPLIREALNKA